MTGGRNPYSSRKSRVSPRALRTLILLFLLPPVGLAYMWRNLVFQNRGRIILTGVCCLEMMLLFSAGLFGLISWNSLPPTDEPVAGVAAAVTPYPDEATINALSNIDDLIEAGMAQIADNVVPEATPVVTQQEQLLQQQEVLGTVVYAVYNGARYYHAVTVCGNQSNRRELTVQEAMAEGLAACPNCSPATLN